MIRDREIDLINTFVVRARRSRYIGFLDSTRGRQKFLRTLYHFPYFEPAYVVPIVKGNNSVDAIIDELRRRGADKECYVISVSKDWDGVTGRVEDVIAHVHGWVEGTLVSCGRHLAYYEGEGSRCILERKLAQGSGKKPKSKF
jgi:hypothetical protein